jgi:ankyrin repeat protein
MLEPNYSLFESIHYYDFQFFKSTINSQTDLNILNKDGYSLLNLSVYYNYIEFIDILVNLGADINLANKDGNTPLHLASKIKAKNTVQSLLLTPNSINLNFKNRHNKTALDIAYEQKKYELVDMVNSYKNYKEISSLDIFSLECHYNKNIKQKL